MRKHSTPKNPVTLVCAYCGKPFDVFPSEQHLRHCSKSCASYARKYPTAAERLEHITDRSAGRDACWLLTSNLEPQGYGVFHTPQGTIKAHRLAYELAYGPIPEGMLVRHKCPGGGNRACVNPRHLALGTIADNMRDREEDGRTARGDRNGRRTKPEATARGERAACVKLTIDAVREIRRAYAAGEADGPRLAARFGVSPSTIWAVLRRQTWGHVT